MQLLFILIALKIYFENPESINGGILISVGGKPLG
jgi:hypothetical protein